MAWQQVGGHPGAVRALDGGARVVKACSTQEAEFYLEAWRDAGAAHARLQECIPKCFAIQIEGRAVWGDAVGGDGSAVVLENLAHGYENANVCDIKLGQLLYDERPGYTTPEKIARMHAKAQQTTSGTLGVRVTGWSVWTDGTSATTGKEPGRAAQTLDDVGRLLTEALCLDDPLHRAAAQTRLLPRIRALQAAMRTVPVQLRGASVLLVVDASAPQRCDARLIDFAHSRFDREPDPGLTLGLATLIRALETYT